MTEALLSRTGSAESGCSPALSRSDRPGSSPMRSKECNHGSVCRRVIETDLDLGAAKPQADLARQVLVASAGGGRSDPPARAECGACGVRDARDLVSPRVDGLPAVCIDARH